MPAAVVSKSGGELLKNAADKTLYTGTELKSELKDSGEMTMADTSSWGVNHTRLRAITAAGKTGCGHILKLLMQNSTEYARTAF